MGLTLPGGIEGRERSRTAYAVSTYQNDGLASVVLSSGLYPYPLLTEWSPTLLVHPSPAESRGFLAVAYRPVCLSVWHCRFGLSRGATTGGTHGPHCELFVCGACLAVHCRHLARRSPHANDSAHFAKKI